MTRITEHSQGGAVRQETLTTCHKFAVTSRSVRHTVVSVGGLAPQPYDAEQYFLAGIGGMVPTGGSLELAYEPDGGQGWSQAWLNGGAA